VCCVPAPAVLAVAARDVATVAVIGTQEEIMCAKRNIFEVAIYYLYLVIYFF